MDRVYLTRVEAADYIRISVPQLDVLARERKLPRVKFGTGEKGQRVLYRRADLDKFIASHMSDAEEPDAEATA
jgi:excisionase family DNA binding protein